MFRPAAVVDFEAEDRVEVREVHPLKLSSVGEELERLVFLGALQLDPAEMDAAARAGQKDQHSQGRHPESCSCLESLSC